MSQFDIVYSEHELKSAFSVFVSLYVFEVLRSYLPLLQISIDFRTRHSS
jgi:hypothetical protein